MLTSFADGGSRLIRGDQVDLENIGIKTRLKLGRQDRQE